MTISTLPYRRILLKLSGEMLLNGQSHGISPHAAQSLAASIKSLKESGLEIGIVIGGGNIFRGIQSKAMALERSAADQMGMLATLINGIALQQALENADCPTRLLTALECPKVAETYTWHGALEYLAAGNIVLFVGGTGNAYFTTDTAAALRASEIHADILLKATKVDGIFNKDPMKYKDAVKYDELSYSQMLAEKLDVMDATSVTLCRSSRIPILVFNMNLLESCGVIELLSNKKGGTFVHGD